MSSVLVGSVVIGYFLVLMAVSYVVSRKSSDEDFYTAHRRSPWYLVAFGMIGASLSGVTFISVPGQVGSGHFYYFQVVLGYLLGYAVISHILLPLYYRLNLVSIYSYLEDRFGFWSYKTGAFFFILSRVIGASFRLFLVAGVLQVFFFDSLELPFWVSVLTTVMLIWLYTFRGGIKTVVWTDTLQTAFMLIAVGLSIWFIKEQMNLSFGEMITNLTNDKRSTIFHWEWAAPTHFFKQFISGMFITIVMTGLDQDMMQKNLTCRTLKDAQKNIFWFCGVLVVVNLLFLVMGLLLYQFAETIQMELPARADYLFPIIAKDHFPLLGGVIFLFGVTAAAYSSADSALTALTTSFCIDFLGFNKDNFGQKKRQRMVIHFGFSLVLFAVILIFEAINDDSVIIKLFKAAGYTYGPLLGMYAFGIFTKWQLRDRWVPLVCLISPVLSYIINLNSSVWFGGYKFGFEILLVNGLFTFIGLLLIRDQK